MGWWGLDILDGDKICDIHIAILDKCKIKLEKYNYNHEAELSLEDKENFLNKIPNILKSFQKKQEAFGVYNKEDEALFWQAFLITIINNKIKINPLILGDIVTTHFKYKKFLREDAEDFDQPNERIANLDNFDKKVSKFFKKMQEEFYPNTKIKKVKML